MTEVESNIDVIRRHHMSDHRANRDDLGMLQQLGIVPGLDARSDLLPPDNPVV